MSQLRVGQFSLGVGLILGGLEMIHVGFNMPMALTIGQLLVLAALALLLNSLLAWVLGIICGALVSVFSGKNTHYTVLENRGLSLCVLILSAWMLWPLANDIYEQGRVAPAFVLGSFSLIFAGLTWTNAGFWLRKEYREEKARHSWRKISFVFSLFLVLIGLLLGANRDYGSSNAIDTDPDIVLITVDTLRRDHVSAYHEDPSQAPVLTPELDALADEGLLFWDAVTPIPETLPAHAAIMTGRHPATAQVLSNGHPLSRTRYTTLAQYFSDEGYSTSAFVSSYALDSRGGLDRGFQLYDDQFIPGFPGASELQIVGLALRALMRFGSPAWFPWLLERSSERTLDNAVTWLSTYSDKPAFLWVHLFEPHAPYEPHGLTGFEVNGTPDSPAVDHRFILENEKEIVYTDELQEQLKSLYREEVAFIDAQIGDFVRQVRDRPTERDTLFVITADHGEMLGEHSIMFHHLSLFEPAIQVPLIILPIQGSTRQGIVDQPVRLMDLYNTIIGQAGFPFETNTHSMDIVKFIGEETFIGYGVFLMGRDKAGVERGNLFGYRSKTENTGNYFKYIYEPDRKKHWLFSLTEDPEETMNSAELQPELFQQLKEITLQSMSDVPQLAPSVGSSELEALRALGYVE